MSTPAQIAANRRNALNSTGPRTADGKAVSSQNARKERELILPFENPEDYSALAGALRLDLAPQTPTEAILVDSIIAAAWRIRRARTLEAGLIYAGLPTTLTLDPATESAIAFRKDSRDYGSLDKLSRHEARLERQLRLALETLVKFRQSNPNEPNSETALMEQVINICNT